MMKDKYIRTDLCGYAFNGKFPPNTPIRDNQPFRIEVLTISNRYVPPYPSAKDGWLR